jgi:hypothetical protein
MPFESAVTVPKPSQLLVHGPDKDGAQSTVTVLPGWRCANQLPIRAEGTDDGSLRKDGRSHQGAAKGTERGEY